MVVVMAMGMGLGIVDGDGDGIGNGLEAPLKLNGWPMAMALVATDHECLVPAASQA